MRVTRTLRNQCGASRTCDKIHDTDDPADLIIQGRYVDPSLRERLGVPEEEGLLAVKRSVFPEAAGTPMLDLDAFGALLDKLHTRDLFRVETLGYYADDEHEYAQWRRGEQGPDLEWKAGWLDALRADHAAGRQWRVLHVVDGPITDYVAYEMAWCYQPNQEAGQEIRILDLRQAGLPSAAMNAGDFMVVDDNTVIRMHYSDTGEFVGANIINQDPTVFVALRDLMWAAATPFSTWWAQHTELHHARRAA